MRVYNKTKNQSISGYLRKISHSRAFKDASAVGIGPVIKFDSSADKERGLNEKKILWFHIHHLKKFGNIPRLNKDMLPKFAISVGIVPMSILKPFNI